MRLPSPSIRRTIIAAAIIAAVLVLAAILIRTVEPETQVSPPAKEGVGEVRARPVFSIVEIDGIDDVVNAVAQGTDGTKETGKTEGVAAAVLPHHTLAGPKLMELWTDIADRSDPSVIVVIGPNHDNDGSGLVQTTHGVWTSPFGTVETDDGLVDRLVSLGVATDEEGTFVNEHAVGTHVPYLAELFPGVPILPVIAKSPAGADEALSLVLVLQQILPDDALVVSSIDFSHYLPQDATDAMDAETLAHIAARRYTELERLHSDHLDAPYAMIAYLLWGDRNGFHSDLVWQETSHRLMNDPNAPGTSYLVFFSTSKTSKAPITSKFSLSLAGDIMLGRAVATSLSRTTVAQAFAPAASTFEGSDLAFANLESVLTSSNLDAGKEIYFKADPARVDALKYLGLTHVSVANNHVDDYGLAGWEESVRHLTDAGIVPVGDFYNAVEPVVAAIGEKEVVFLAYEDLYRPVDAETLSEQVAAADLLGDVLVVSFHWGAEYEHVPSQRQTDLAHAAVDAGADVVVGHHPHVLQGIETYNGGLILYSLGNFVFDQVGEDENESLVVRLTWNDDGTRSLKLVPMRIAGTFPRVASEAERVATIGRMIGWSQEASAAMDFPESFAASGEMSW